MKPTHRIITGAFILFFCLIVSQFATADAPAQQTELDQYYHWLDMGKKAIPELKIAVKSDNWRLRTHALLAMGKLGDQSLIPIVLDRLTHDDTVAVKNCAVVALGDLNASSAAPALIDLLDKDTAAAPETVLPEKRLIVQSLGKIKDPRAVKPLHDLMLKEPEQTRAEIATTLISIGDPKISHMLLADSKENASYPRLQAAEILGELPVAGADDFLLTLMSGAPVPLQNVAVIALGKMKSEKSTPILITLFETDDQLLAQNVSDALIAINSSKTILPLCAFLESRNSKTAMAAALVLSRMSSDDIGATVFEKIKTDHSINAPAAFILGRKGYTGATVLLRQRLKNEKEPGQNEMAEALGLLKDGQSIDLLITVAKRKDFNGSQGAIWALGDLKAEKALPVLFDLLEKRNRQLTMPLIFALGSIGNQSAVKPLIDLYYESGLQYQHQIALSLAQIGGPEVADFIKTNMDSDDEKRRRMAGFILLKSTDKTLQPYVISLLDHPDEAIRKYAMGYLVNTTGENFESANEWKAWAKKKNPKSGSQNPE